MRVITCSRNFPKGHIRAGEPTYFVEKIWKSIWDGYDGSANPLYPWWENYDKAFPVRGDLKENIHQHEPKHTTIRSGNRWKAGDMASLRVWSGVPRRSKQIEFAQVEVKKTWEFIISPPPISYRKNERWAYVGGRLIGILDHPETELKTVARNDGLSIEDFISWFSIHPKKTGEGFKGQIISWHDNLKY